MDSKTRSLVKGITWRLVNILIMPPMLYTIYLTAGISITKLVLLFTICFQIISTILYYIHERIWERVKWGKRTGAVDQ